MKVFEVSIKVFLLKDIKLDNIFTEISNFIDSGMATIPKLLDFHNRNTYKNYCFGLFYPLEKDKLYKVGNIYTIKIRTIDMELAEFFNNNLVNHFNATIKGLTSEIRVIPKKHIDKIYSITPVVLKNDMGYWRNILTLDDFERRLKENLVKKYNNIMGTKVNEKFQLYTGIEFKNRKPIAINYKGKKILGDKICITISDDEISQELAYLALGCGILEMNGRGAGFMNFRWS